MGNTKSHDESQAASNESCQSTCDSCESAAEKYGVKAENSGKKKKRTKIGGGVTSGVLMGAGVAAGGTAGTIAVGGTIASVAVGIPTLGVGLLVGLSVTAAAAGVAAGFAGITGAAATHIIAKHYEDNETTFKEAQEDLLKKCASTRHYDVANDSTPTLQDLFQLVVANVAAKWKSVAICLGMKACIIDIISKNYPNDCEGACVDMLKRWLAIENHTGEMKRTWSTLLTALKEAGFVHLVQDLQRKCLKRPSKCPR